MSKEIYILIIEFVVLWMLIFFEYIVYWAYQLSKTNAPQNTWLCALNVVLVWIIIIFFVLYMLRHIVK